MERTRRLVRREQWRHVRARGWWRFVLVEGALKFGVLLYLVAYVAPRLVQHHAFPLRPAPLLIGACCFAGSRLLIGAVKWWVNQRRFAGLTVPPHESGQ